MNLSSALRSAGATALLLAATHADALVIEDGMDATITYPQGITDTFPWTRTVFGGTEMTSGAGQLSLSTNPNVGVWFGNGNYIGHNPGWSFGPNSAGTYVSVRMKLSLDAADWSLYFYDTSGYAAALAWNPAGSYSVPVQHGFEFLYAEPGNVGATAFRSFDLTDDFHTFEILARNGQVSYAVDQHLIFSGAAVHTGATDLLVIGDGSGSTPTGVGNMLVDHVIVDTAPTMTALTTVPVPASAPLLAAATALLAGLRRRAHRSRD